MQNVEDIMNIGFNYHQEGKLESAEEAYHEALKLDNKNAEVYNLLGVLKLQQNDIISAINWIEKAVDLNPNEYFYETLIQAYQRALLYRQIAAKEEFIIEHFPNNFSLLFNLGLAFKNLKQNKKAILYYEKALKINPASYKAWFNLSHLYSIEAEVKNALSAMEICKKLQPQDDETDYFLSLILMRLKNYDKGLKLFEKRVSKIASYELQKKSYPNKIREDNLWHGENIKDKTILIYYEAGFGDVIMFSRYLPLVAKKCKKLLFMVQKPLAPLFQENLNLGIDEIIDRYIPEAEIDFDVHAPLLSLPYILGLKGSKVFAYQEGYLRPNKSMVDEYKNKYFNNNKIKVGIKWQGNTYYDQDRVIPTKCFLPLMKVDNTQYYSFQTFEGLDDIKLLDGIVDLGKDFINFSQTAAAMANLDLVICNDTSLAHLAGAMGIPCWMVLPYEVNWRWHVDLSICDWYNSVRLFRQHNIGDWDSAFNDILQQMV